MNEKELQNEIQKTYIYALEAAKNLEPCSPEWDFVWGILNTSKEYLEEKKRAKDCDEDQ